MEEADLQHAKMKHDAIHRHTGSKGPSLSRTSQLVQIERCPCAPCFDCPLPLQFLVNPLKLGESRFLRIWDCICCAALVYVCFATPVEVAFMDVVVNSQFAVNIAISMLFLGDMLLQFVVPVTIVVPDRGLTKVYNKRLIRRNYLKTWFAIDLVSILPFDTVSLIVASSQTSMLGHIRILRLVKLLRLVKGLRLWRRYATDLAWSYRKMMLAQLFLTVIVVAHWISCFLGAISRFETEQPCIGRDDGWQEDGRCSVTWMSTSLQWIGTSRNTDKDDHPFVPVINTYSVSLLTSVTILVHPYFPVVQPTTVLDVLFITWFILVGGLIWTRVISKSTGMFTSLDRHNIYYHQMMDDMNDVMANLGMNAKYKAKLRAYFMRMRDLSKQDTWKQIMERMSPSLRREVTWETNRVWAKRVPCLVGCTHVMITEVAEALGSHRFSQREYFGEAYNLYIMQLGKATRWAKKGAHGLQVKGAGEFWGEEQLFLSNPKLLPSNIALAVSYVEVKSISRDRFDSICSEYPENFECLRSHYLRYLFQAGVWYYKELVAKCDAVMNNEGRNVLPEEYDISKSEIPILSYRLGERIDEFTRLCARKPKVRSRLFYGPEGGEGSVSFGEAYESHDHDQHQFQARRQQRDMDKLVPTKRLCFLEQPEDGMSPRYHRLSTSKEHAEMQRLHSLLHNQGKRIEEEVGTVRREVREKAFVICAQQRALMELIQQRWPTDSSPQSRPTPQSRRQDEPVQPPKRRGIFKWSSGPQSRKGGAKNEALQVRVGVIGESRGAEAGTARLPVQVSSMAAGARDRENTEDNSVGSNEVHGTPVNTMTFDLAR